jgi:hypothetical protein
MLPQPGHQYINWFYEEDQKKSLVLQPKYQRNPVWSERQRCFLIDSILSGIPIGQVFLNVVTKGQGLHKKTEYEVVDGQQRLRTILDFMRDNFALVRIPTSTYPVSDLYGNLVGKKYSNLSEDYQDKIWNYPIAVQELREYSDKEIRDMFRRLNYVVERLTRQELRHSQFFGEFTITVEHLAQNTFWETATLFSRNDYQRMRDLEFISELFIIVIDGVQDQQKTIDQFYAKYDSSFPSKGKHIKRFETVLEHLLHFLPLITGSRFGKKADFYALFAATSDVLDVVSWTSKGERKANRLLRKLASALEQPPHELTGVARAYYGTVIEGPNKLAKRIKRTEILRDLLADSFPAS